MVFAVAAKALALTVAGASALPFELVGSVLLALLAQKYLLYSYNSTLMLYS